MPADIKSAEGLIAGLVSGTVVPGSDPAFAGCVSKSATRYGGELAAGRTLTVVGAGACSAEESDGTASIGHIRLDKPLLGASERIGPAKDDGLGLAAAGSSDDPMPSDGPRDVDAPRRNMGSGSGSVGQETPHIVEGKTEDFPPPERPTSPGFVLPRSTGLVSLDITMALEGTTPGALEGAALEDTGPRY